MGGCLNYKNHGIFVIYVCIAIETTQDLKLKLKYVYNFFYANSNYLFYLDCVLQFNKFHPEEIYSKKENI